MIAPNISTQPRISRPLRLCPRISHPAITEIQRGYGRIHVFLTDDLQSVGNTAGEDSGIEERDFGSKNATEIRAFKEQCRNSGEDAADKELYAGHFYSVHQR